MLMIAPLDYYLHKSYIFTPPGAGKRHRRDKKKASLIGKPSIATRSNFAVTYLRRCDCSHDLSVVRYL